jgi:hypothetical protein
VPSILVFAPKNLRAARTSRAHPSAQKNSSRCSPGLKRPTLNLVCLDQAKQVKVQAWQNRIVRVVNTQKQVDIHNNVESMRLQMEEGLQTSFLVAWSLVELKNDSDQKVLSNLVYSSRFNRHRADAQSDSLHFSPVDGSFF